MSSEVFLTCPKHRRAGRSYFIAKLLLAELRRVDRYDMVIQRQRSDQQPTYTLVDVLHRICQRKTHPLNRLPNLNGSVYALEARFRSHRLEGSIFPRHLPDLLFTGRVGSLDNFFLGASLTAVGRERCWHRMSCRMELYRVVQQLKSMSIAYHRQIRYPHPGATLHRWRMPPRQFGPVLCRPIYLIV